MYCPDGYETLATAYRRCSEAAFVWSENQPPIMEPKYPGLFFSSEALDSEYRRGAYREWLWYRFARHTYNKLFCASETGMVLRLDVESGRFFLMENENFPDSIADQKALDAVSGDIYFWIDNRAFAIRSMHEDIEDQYYDPTGFQRKVMAPLIGRPVLWKPPKPDLRTADFAQFVLAPFGEVSTAPPDRRPVGRPPKGQNLELRRIVRSVFAEQYGNQVGIKKESIVAEAQAWVKRHSGEDISRTTVQTWLAAIWDGSAGKPAG